MSSFLSSFVAFLCFPMVLQWSPLILWSGPSRPQRPRVVCTVALVPSTSFADAQGLPTGAAGPGGIDGVTLDE